MVDYASLLPFCESDAQRGHIQSLIEHGSIRKAARATGRAHRRIEEAVSRVRKAAARRGFSPVHGMTRPVPDSHVAKGVSTLYDADGVIRAQWVKSALKPDEQIAALREAVEAVAESVSGLAKPVAAPKRSNADLLTVYPIGDAHIGMYAWAQECGEPFDCDIARADLLGAVSRLTEVAPPSERALIVNVGDWYHADSIANATMRSHATLDVDTRWPRVLRVGWQLMVDLIGLALKKHQHVEVINAVGNHDDHSAVFLSAVLQAWFRDEPRVTVRETVGKFHYAEHGRNLIGITHGDTVKLQELASLMASDCPEMWGKTEHRYWYTGHIHHSSKLELRGCVVESFRTLAAKDSWHTAQGYRSGRDMYAIVLDKEDGEVERYRCDIRRARRAS